jgi:hypothetical protein
MHMQAMLSTHPRVHGQANQVLIRATEACFDCAQTCTACADACLGEESVSELRQCIRMNLDCADICFATGLLGTRQTGSDERIIELMFDVCAEACQRCEDECMRHAGRHEHCRICAEICRSCTDSCRDAARAAKVH